MKLWYFFISVGFLAISATSFFVSFSLWESARRVSTIESKPKRVALWAGVGVVFLVLAVFVLTL
ncbi:hypothetical protein OG223_31460 [Streptomyces sp. NBC_01478]|uniref:hypothetical protein n=1 Tax=Streptomyces sp. NBC_01478 TaxID=2903882 RepID=UPI002E378C8F|nr:hypothetical protein [Streptomyces sp. NBC_01478]